MSKRRKTRHHRIMVSHGGTNKTGNISIVSKKRHEAFHTLFNNMTPSQIARELTETWLPSSWKVIAVVKRKKARKRSMWRKRAPMSRTG